MATPIAIAKMNKRIGILEDKLKMNRLSVIDGKISVLDDKLERLIINENEVFPRLIKNEKAIAQLKAQNTPIGIPVATRVYGGRRTRRGRRKKTRKKRGGVIVNGVDIALNPFDKPFKNNLNNQYIGKYFRFTTKNDVGEVFEYDGRLMGFTRDGKPRFVSPSVPGGQIAPGWQQFVQIWMYKADTDVELNILSFLFGPQQAGRRRKKRTRRRKSRRRMRGKRKGKSRRRKR